MSGRRLGAFERGYLQGLRAYAVWRDGVQYVGSSGTTLAVAIARFLHAAGAGDGYAVVSCRRCSISYAIEIAPPVCGNCRNYLEAGSLELLELAHADG